MKTTRRTFLKLLGGATALVTIPMVTTKVTVPMAVIKTNNGWTKVGPYTGGGSIKIHVPANFIIEGSDSSDFVDALPFNGTQRYVRAKYNFNGEGNGQ